MIDEVGATGAYRWPPLHAVPAVDGAGVLSSSAMPVRSLRRTFFRTRETCIWERPSSAPIWDWVISRPKRMSMDLTGCGVKVFQYQPAMLHTKVLTVDGATALIGSTNVNRRSLDHVEEVMLAVLDPPFTATLDRHFKEDLKHSELISPGRWKRRARLQRFREAAVPPLRRLL